jgi:radical SAM superfamily enzyme YgiQ (UPF0313 family)
MDAISPEKRSDVNCMTATEMPRFLLIAPRPPWDADFAGLRDADGVAAGRVAPVAIATVAAMAPAGVEPVLHDESLDPIDFDAPAEFVGITANVSQARRAVEIARAFRARGRTVIIGGPHVTLDPHAFEDICDVVVTGEFEGVADEFYADMLRGTMKPRYEGGRPDLRASPIPAWELFDNDRALIGIAQTSRGCPFECNFCDVIQYVGRAQRHKTNEQVLAEVQRLYDLGYNRIQLADDNFTVYRRRAASLLEALAAWNGREGRDFVTFGTQISIDIASDARMLRLCAEAGLSNLFVGIESVNEESLRASKKRQNLNVDLGARVADIVSNGLEVVAALMVGFDTDDLGIFEQQYEFGMRLPVGTFKISLLVAPIATPLHEEMRRAGRLDPTQDHYPGADLVTNIVPAQMTREELFVGTRWLVSRLFNPDRFCERLGQIEKILAPNPLLERAKPYDPPGRAFTNRLFLRMMRDLSRRDAKVSRAIAYTSDRMRARPDIAHGLAGTLHSWLLALNGHVERGSYDPDWAELPAPPFGDLRSSPRGTVERPRVGGRERKQGMKAEAVEPHPSD